jgi:methionine-rich copper-binding protein CopC
MRSIALLAATIALTGGGQALAHARLLHAVPKVGETDRVSPVELRLAFSEGIDLPKSSVAVTGPAGPVTVGPIRLDPRDPRVVVVPLGSRLATGAYRVIWNATSVDTHHTDGDYAFKVAP